MNNLLHCVRRVFFFFFVLILVLVLVLFFFFYLKYFIRRIVFVLLISFSTFVGEGGGESKLGRIYVGTVPYLGIIDSLLFSFSFKFFFISHFIIQIQSYHYRRDFYFIYFLII